MLESAAMGFSDVVQVMRPAAAVLGLALVGRMRVTARGVTHSIGLVSRLGADLTELPRSLHQADEALYEAKAAGRNQVTVAESPDASLAAA